MNLSFLFMLLAIAGAILILIGIYFIYSDGTAFVSSTGTVVSTGAHISGSGGHETISPLVNYTYTYKNQSYAGNYTFSPIGDLETANTIAASEFPVGTSLSLLVLASNPSYSKVNLGFFSNELFPILSMVFGAFFLIFGFYASRKLANS